MNSSTSADLPIRRRPRTMTHLPGGAEPTSPRTSASIPSSRASSRRRPTKPAIAAPKTIPIDTSLRDTILIGSIHQSSVSRQRGSPLVTDTSGKGSSGGAVSVCGSVESLERDQAVHPDAGTSPSRFDVTSRLGRQRVHDDPPSARSREFTATTPAAGDPDDRPVPARQVIHAEPRNPPPAPQLRANTAVPPLPDDINGTDQALHSARTPSAGHHFPTTDSAPRDRKPGSGQDPHKIPTPHATHRPCQHHKDINPSRHFRWSEVRLASSRDKTRTYNLPVNRRSVAAGKIRSCHNRQPALPA